MKLLMIDGHRLKKFIISGANRLNQKKDEVDSLNVFPVPDGDTGTNMSLTVLSAAKEVAKINSPNIHDIAKAVSTGSLKGARGNSGVILSQLFRGFCKGLEGKDRASAKDIAEAFSKGVESAYKAVMKPKEGTILTVSKAISEKSLEMANKTEDIVEMMKEVLSYANSVLDKTRNMLPELKQAGVVDAGGKGLISILEGGFFDSGEYIELYEEKEPKKLSDKNIKEIDIKYGYCTEFFINIKNNNDNLETELKSFLESIGDSIVLASDDDFIKIHVHTNNPGKVLERAMLVGSLDNIKIENMRTQHSNLIDFTLEKEPSKDYGFVAVSIGEGIDNLFKEYGVDELITGGQTMNPSIEDILNAVDRVDAKNVFILPNNKNIILASEQVKEACTSKNVEVIETLSIAQGFSALTSFLSTDSLEKNIKNMNEAIKYVSTGQITYAVRDTSIDGIDIVQGDILCMIDGKIKNVSKDIELGTKELIDKMIEEKEDAFNISIYYGSDIKEEEAKKIENYVSEKYDYLDFELIYGGQPLYYYIISIE